MAYLTEWTRLPHIAPEDTPHYSGTNPEDRRMLYAAGEASLLNGWEEHPDPRAWIRKVAWNLIKRRKLEDEDEYISAFAHGIEIESRDAPKQEKVCGRLGEATSKPDRRSIPLITARNDPLAALLPASTANVEDLHAALDWQKHCRELGLSEEATRVGLVRFALAKKDTGISGRMQRLDRQMVADLVGIHVTHLTAREQELRRALPSLVERLSIYGLDRKQTI